MDVSGGNGVRSSSGHSSSKFIIACRCGSKGKQSLAPGIRSRSAATYRAMEWFIAIRPFANRVAFEPVMMPKRGAVVGVVVMLRFVRRACRSRKSLRGDAWGHARPPGVRCQERYPYSPPIAASLQVPVLHGGG